MQAEEHLGQGCLPEIGEPLKVRQTALARFIGEMLEYLRNFETERADWTKGLLYDTERRNSDMIRVGMGYDVHKLTEGRDLILGGVNIPWEKGLLGHSDADVVVHAIMDALLGAAALRDIGRHFPDTDPQYKGISSIKLLQYVGKLLEENLYVVNNIDATIIAQKPKLLPYIDQMISNVAEALHLEENQVNIKATTEEGLGFTGSMEGISAHAVCALTSVKDLEEDDRSFSCGGCCRERIF